jgi:hypothetical protein
MNRIIKLAMEEERKELAERQEGIKIIRAIQMNQIRR